MGKVAIGLRIWLALLLVKLEVSGHPLPDAAARIGRSRSRHPLLISPRQLSGIVRRSLRVGPYRPRCLLQALVLYRLLCEGRVRAELVIGLPTRVPSKDAHAWVEVGGVDIGPEPGGAQHAALVRYASS